MLGPQDRQVSSSLRHFLPTPPMRQRRGGWLITILGLLAFAPALAEPDYALLDAVLLANVRNGYVDYDGIAADPRFDRFITGLAAARDGAGDRAQDLAFYINAYNAFAIRGILEGHSPATRFGRSRFFRSQRFDLDGERVSLDQIEHERLRPLGDPRTHFAIACAALSCPRLANRAWLPGSIDAQLDEAARRFINDNTRNRFDVAQKRAFLSPAFDSFGADFTANAGSVPAFIARYVEDPAVRAALLEGRLSLTWLPQDWDLNGQLTAKPSD